MGDYPSGSLAWWIDERRAELGITWTELARRVDVSRQTLNKAINGRRMKTETRQRLEDALKWSRGSIEAISLDKMPTPSDPEANTERYLAHEDLLRSVVTEMEQRGVPPHAIRDFLIRIATEIANRSTERNHTDTAS